MGGRADQPATDISTARVTLASDLGPELLRIGVPRDVPVILLIGGASGMEPDAEQAAERVIGECVCPLAAELGAAVIDGGTDAGVMRMAGEARRALGGAFPLIGVVAAALIGDTPAPDGGSQRVFPEPNHSHLVVVPGSSWGDETPWLFDVAQWIAGSRPIRTVLVNGGRIARAEVAESIRRGIPAIAIRGTGRAADDVGTDDAVRASERSYDSDLIEVAEATDVYGLRALLAAALRGT